MNLPGRSVEAASLVIEIDEVSVAISASDRSCGVSFLKICALDLLLFGGGLDHHVAIAEQRVIETGGDARQRRVLVVFADPAAGDLARQIALYRRPPALQCVLVHVGDHDVEPGQRADMGDAAAHLPGADDPDAAQPVERRRRCRRAVRARAGAHWRRSSSAASSGRILNRSPTRP